jgi:hypothetical protein
MRIVRSYDRTRLVKAIGSACCTSLKVNHSLGFDEEDEWRECRLVAIGVMLSGGKGSERVR